MGFYLGSQIYTIEEIDEIDKQKYLAWQLLSSGMLHHMVHISN
jgi:hypothetical protein